MSRYKSSLHLVAVLAVFFVACGGEDFGASGSTGGDTATDAINEAGGDVLTGEIDAEDGCEDEDGDGYGEGCSLGFDCNDGVRQIHENAEELCDNLDNNCNGTIDEDCPCADLSIRYCYSGDPETAGVGRCMIGWQMCAASEWGECQGEVLPSDESCDGLDNNCDGTVDEDLTNACGLCGDVGAEVCGDGLDNNCDGTIDESSAGCDCDDRTHQSCYGGPPHTMGVGDCQGGFFDCEGVDWGACRGQNLPTDETCDGHDNDCDGLIDEGLVNACGECGAETPQEICDGIDNDCDGLVDEGLTLVCGFCSADGLTEVCGDGLDNNCDNRVDEFCSCDGPTDCYPGPPEAQGVGACTTGTRACDVTGEFWEECTGYVLPQPEICDGIDNDCDDLIDISPLGCDICARDFEECDGIDNDCDGIVDEYVRNSCGDCVSDVVPEETCGDDCCNGEDDDCDGLIDEGLLNACGTCGESCYVEFNAPSDDDYIGEGGSLIDADDPDNPSGRGGITLATDIFMPPFLWAANDRLDTVSRFNIVDLEEQGRYWVGDNPSRTAVDLDGNMWVGGRNDGRLTKVLWDTEGCPDRNENGEVDTATADNLGPHNSSGNPMVDECVAYSEVPNPSLPSIRGIAAGTDGTIWFGYTNGGVQSIDPHTFELGPYHHNENVPLYAPDAGGIQQPVMLPDGITQATNTDEGVAIGGVYGLVVDSTGLLYVSRTGNPRPTLARFDTNTGQWDAVFTEYVCGGYGIAVDARNRVWSGGWPGCRGIGMFDPATMKFYYFAVPDGLTMTPLLTSGIDPNPVGGCGSPSACVTGVAAEPATGDIWASFYNVGYTGRLSIDEDNYADSQWTFIGTIWDEDGSDRLSGVRGNDLRGVGFDVNGYAWTLGNGSDRVWMLDPATNSRAAELPAGRSIGGATLAIDETHYTYSDFTGSTALSFTAPSTLWQYIFDSGYANAQPDVITWEAYVPAETSAGLRVRVLDDTGSPASDWIPAPIEGAAVYDPYPTGAAEHAFDLLDYHLSGHQFEVEVQLSTSNPDVQPIVHSVEIHWQRP